MRVSKPSMVITGLGVSIGILASVFVDFLIRRYKKSEKRLDGSSAEENDTDDASLSSSSLGDEEMGNPLLDSIIVDFGELPYHNGDISSSEELEVDGERRKSKIKDMIFEKKSKFKDFNRIKVRSDFIARNCLLEEIYSLDSPVSDIQQVPNLILDLGIEELATKINPLTEKFDKEAFINKHSYVLSHSEFGPETSLQHSRKWMRAGPRLHNYFTSEDTKAVILTQGGVCPGQNVIIREILMHLVYNYKIHEVYGAKYGWKGIVKRDWEKLIPSEIKSIHRSGGTYLGSSNEVFHKDLIIQALVEGGFNQVYAICETKCLGEVLELYYEIRKRKLNIAICSIPFSVQNDIPIIDYSFGFLSAVQEAQRIIESAEAETTSNRNGIGLVRLIGDSTGFLAMEASLSSQCQQICLVPEFRYQLYGSTGLLEYLKTSIQKRGNALIVVSQGVSQSFDDVDEIHDDIGKFLLSEILKYFHKQHIRIAAKYFDPHYMVRTVSSNAYDTQLCSNLAQSVVNSVMAGFTGFSIGNVLTKILSENYSISKLSGNRDWYRLLAQTGQPLFLSDSNDNSCNKIKNQSIRIAN